MYSKLSYSFRVALSEQTLQYNTNKCKKKSTFFEKKRVKYFAFFVQLTALKNQNA